MMVECLKVKTPKEWVVSVLNNFDQFLLDHAACERKAASLAMSFVVKYPDRTKLIDPMVSLALEELKHFQQVYQVLLKRNLMLPSKDEKDIYVNQLLKTLRHGRNERLLDRLLMSAVIEARGYERFSLLADNLKDQEMKKFYQNLAHQELGHYKIFIKVAEYYFSKEEIAEAFATIIQEESNAMLQTPITHRLH
jgi:tRNA-(ms[2]io[6]A)-hydroxylase